MRSLAQSAARSRLPLLASQVHGRYNKRDTHNLARFISIAKARARCVRHGGVRMPAGV
jgi:hypothetical protein